MSSSPDHLAKSEAPPSVEDPAPGSDTSNDLPAEWRQIVQLARRLQGLVEQPAPSVPKTQRHGKEKRESLQLGTCIHKYFQLVEEFWRASAVDQVRACFNAKKGDLETLTKDITSAELVRMNWRRHHYQQAMKEWLAALNANSTSFSPDIVACGKALYSARGRVGLARMAWFAYRMLQFLCWICGGVSLVAALWFLVIIAFLKPDDFNATLLKIVIFLPFSLSLTVIVFWGPRLNILIGYLLDKASFGRGTIQLIVLAPGFIVFALEALLFLLFFGYVHAMPVDFHILQNPYLVLQLLLLVVVATFFLLLPLTLLLQIRLWRDLFGPPAHPIGPQWLRDKLPQIRLTWLRTALGNVLLGATPDDSEAQWRSRWASPQVRQAALRSTLYVTWFHCVLLLFAAYEILTFTDARIGRGVIFTVAVPLTNITILVGRQVITYVLTLILPYVLLIEWPYRRGIKRWRAEQLNTLEQKRSKKAGRLANAFEKPGQGDPFAIEDYYSWEYYGKQMEEVKAVSAAPFTLTQRSLVIGLGIVSGLLLDQLKNLLDLLLPHVTH